MPFNIVRNDITKMNTDAIVNTANPNPLIGTGTDTAIYDAAGAEKLLKARQKIGQIARGEAAITKGFKLQAKYIIHTVGPVWEGGSKGEKDILRACYVNSLNLAKKKRCKSIAFPLISTGNYGFPKDIALKIVNDTVREFLNECPDMQVTLVVFDEESTRVSEMLYPGLEKYINDHYAEEKAKESARVDNRITPVSSSSDQTIKYSARVSDPDPDLDFDYKDFKQQRMQQMLSEMRLSPKAVPQKKSERSLSDLLSQQNETFTQMLLRLIKERGLKNSDAYKRANQDKRLFAKIKNDINYQPKKTTVVAFALGLELSLDETKDLLLRAGYALSPSSKFDLVIEYLIEHEVYDIFEVEEVLFEYGLPLLCSYN